MKHEIAMALAALSLAVAGTLIGCRQPHLGPDTGRAYHEALAAQRASQAAAPAFTAEDARQTLRARRGQAGAAAVGETTTLTPVPLITAPVTSGGLWPGASGNIQLEAK